MNETTFKNKVTNYLKTVPGCWFVKIWGGGFQRAGIPDILGCINGKFFALELKSDNGNPSTLQMYVLAKIQKCGGIASVVYPDDFEDLKIRLEKERKS